ncbi:MAG: diphosphate--fructose-6-phosphate 1-phosphotransferase [Oscillospiraceae bacterium]
MKNILIGQSGGPSVAINSSLAGVIKKGTQSVEIGTVYGARNGITGVINDNIVDLSTIASDDKIKILKQTPAMALGSCRYKLPPFQESSRQIYMQIEETLKKYDIGCFFYIGGNDSMDTVAKLDCFFKERKLDIKAIGIPKTIDNDLPVTDHTPGFGSSAKYLFNTVSEIICDSEIYPVKNVVIVEIMGRSAGWLTLAAGLPKILGGDSPQIIALPEVSFSQEEFISTIKKELTTKNTVVAVVSEGIKYASGEYVGMATKNGETDIFGHSYLSGVGKYLEMLVKDKIGCKVRSIELNVMQRCSSHLAALADIDEAFEIGVKAVEAALSGQSGVTLCFNRISDAPYEYSITTTDVNNIANKEKNVPPSWFDYNDPKVQKEIANYLLPLIKGNVIPIVNEQTGLPLYLKI